MKLSQAISHTLDSWHGLKSEKQMTGMAQAILKQLGDVDLDTINPKTLNRTMWGGLAPATRKKKVSILNKIMTEARDNGWAGELPKVPKIKVENDKLSFLTTEQLRMILAECEKPMRQFITFMLETACRPSEALDLSWDDLGRNGVTPVMTFKNTKNGKSRTIPATAKVQAILSELGRNRKSDKVFSLPPYRTVINHWQKACLSSGVSDGTGDWSIYIVRHTSASWMIQNGVPIAHISKYLGHSSITMTMRYAKLDTKSLEQAGKTFDNIDF